MPYVQIPNLPAAISLNGTELFEVVQSGVSVRASLGQITTFTGRGIVAGSLVDAPTIAWDVWKYPIASVTLGGNRTLAFPTGLSPGACALYVTQPAVGGPYTLSFAAGYRFPSGAVPALSPTAGAVDILTFMARDSSHMDTVIQRDFA